MIRVTGPQEFVRPAAKVAINRVRGLVRGVLAALVCFLLGAAPAGAAPAWLEPVDVGSAQVVGTPRVGIDGQGNAVAVFERGDFTDSVVQGAVRPAGGAWQAPVDISAPTGNAFSEQVAVDLHGNALAVWIRRVGTNFVAQAAWRPAGGAWQSPVDISDIGVYVADPQVAISANGTAVAVWHNVEGIDYMVQGAVRTAGGAWQTPVDLSVAGASTAVPHVAIDARGDAVAIWERNNGTDSIVQSASRPANGVWQTPVDLSVAGQTTYGSQVEVDARGNAVAVWHRYYDDSNQEAIVQSTVRPAGGDWQAPVDISTGSTYTQPAQVAVDEQGNAVAIWGHLKGGAAVEVQGAVRAAGGDWQAPVDLSAPGIETYEPQLDVDEQGNAVAIWYQNTANNHIYDVQTAVLPAGAKWQAPHRLATTDEVAIPQVALGPQGNGVAVWRTFTPTGPTGIVKSSGYDPAGPLLRELIVPQTGVVGEPVSFSVSPFDVWSALGATSWNFGDGAAASGIAVTHTYPSAGTFSVGVSSADALANHASTTRTITITPAPLPPKPAPSVPPQTIPAGAVMKLRLSPNTFRAARSGPTVTPRTKRTGTRVSYRLNMAARVRFTVERCVTVTRSKRCTRYMRVRGSVTRGRRAGADRFRFTGRLAGRTLQPGRYRLIATPTSNGRPGTPSRVRFRVVR